MTVILILLGIYILYKVVEFLIPIYKTTKRVQKQFRNMQQNRSSENGSYNGNGNSKEAPQPKPSTRDYIEFEEIKD
ncbi:MAG: hypothetical protein WKF89_12145 [Chitinophagaceae bacterium]